MFPSMHGFPSRPGPRTGFTDVAIALAAIAVSALSGCANVNEVSSVTTTKNIAVDNQILSYHHRSDLPWGAVPVVPQDSVGTSLQVALQGGAFAMSEADEQSLGSWSPSTSQGTAEATLTDGIFRGGIGGRIGSAPSMWISIGALDRGQTGAHLFGDVAMGFALGRATVDYRGLRRTEESRKMSYDTLMTSSHHRRWSHFTRISLGLIPDESGPWAMVQLIPSWTMVEWPRGYTEVVTTTTTTYEDSSHTSDIRQDRRENGTSLENALLLSVGAGWTRRFGAQALTVGTRYSIKELHQLEMVLQFSSDL
jgi:hypothetical protein